MIHTYKTYLPFLASKYNILYLGNEQLKIFDQISSYFKNSAKRALNQEELDHIAITLYKEQTDVVIINTKKDNAHICIDFFKAIENYNSDMPVIFIYEPQEYTSLFATLSKVDITLSHPVQEGLFYKKIFTVLSRFYALQAIAQREIPIQNNTISENEEDSMDKFFDIYEGSALFASDTLNEMAKAINSGDLSSDLFGDIVQKLDEIADIFSKTEQTTPVTPIFKELSRFLKELDISTLQPKNLNGFNYLAQILNDISTYLTELFVKRVFKDVYVFEHSLKSNISFMENALLNSKEPETELEFFE